MSVLKLYSN